MWLNGRDLRQRSYSERKKRLRALLVDSATIGYVDHYMSPDLFEAAARLDLEGVIAKRASDAYGPSAEWVKLKHPRVFAGRGTARAIWSAPMRTSRI
jgi:ATP-dependent DNA ligase